MRHLASHALFSLILVACSKDPAAKTDSTPASSTSTTMTSAAPPAVATTTPSAAAAAATAAATGAALSADASGALVFAWKVANAPQEKVTVTAAAAGETLSIGTLHAEADDAPGTIATCATRNLTPTQSKLTCGGTPAYNYYTANLSSGALVITLTTGVDSEPGSEKTTEVLRRPTTATTLKATGPAAPALYGNCRAGQVQQSPEAPCMRQCLKGTECKGLEKCEMITVKGTDGDHKVHACVMPLGK